METKLSGKKEKKLRADTFISATNKINDKNYCLNLRKRIFLIFIFFSVFKKLFKLDCKKCG